MPVTAPVPGPPPVAPAIPVAGLLVQAVQPGVAAEIATIGAPVDLVSLSPAALLQQALNAPGVAMQRLSSLLREFEQITQLTSRAAPLALGKLAAEIGAAAGELGAGVQALLPPPDTAQPPLQLAAIAAQHALRALVSVLRQTGREGAGHAPTVQASREALPADPGREVQAAARVILRSAVDTLDRMQLGLDAAAAPAAVVHREHFPFRWKHLDGNSACRDEDLACRRASGAAKHRLGATGHVPGPGHDTAWCEAQIALALAQVAWASRAIGTLPGTAPRWHRITALLDQHGIRLMGAPGRHRLLVRIGAMLVLLCVAATALWAASRLDLTLARIAAAALLALAALAWSWRRSAPWRQPRLRIEPRR